MVNRMRVLILSCNTGGGHNSASEAIREYIALKGGQADLIDIMSLAGKKASRAVGGAYVGIVKHAPHVFGAAYWLAGKISSGRRKSPVYAANIAVVKYLKQYLETHAYDVIVTPHLYAAETLTYMKRHNMVRQKVVAVATDYTCIPFWEETECDYYIAPHEDLIAENVRRGMDRSKILPYGIPVSQKFVTCSGGISKEKARAMCGLPAGKPVYLVMGGSMGFGKLPDFIKRLQKQCLREEQIVVICGNNKKLYEKLNRQFGKQSAIWIIGYTKQVEVYMKACDVIFTKPGGLTSTEALVMQIPIVHMEPIPGCETKNAAFFSSRGVSVTADGIQGQVDCGRVLMEQSKTRAAMQKAQVRYGKPDAAARIYELLERIVKEGNGGKNEFYEYSDTI